MDTRSRDQRQKISLQDINQTVSEVTINISLKLYGEMLTEEQLYELKQRIASELEEYIRFCR